MLCELGKKGTHRLIFAPLLTSGATESFSQALGSSGTLGINSDPLGISTSNDGWGKRVPIGNAKS